MENTHVFFQIINQDGQPVLSIFKQTDFNKCKPIALTSPLTLNLDDPVLEIVADQLGVKVEEVIEALRRFYWFFPGEKK